MLELDHLRNYKPLRHLGPRRVHVRVEATNERRLKLAHLVHNTDCREKARRGYRAKFSWKIHENIFWWCIGITDKLMRKANDQTKQFISYSFLGRRFTLNLCYCQNSARLGAPCEEMDFKLNFDLINLWLLEQSFPQYKASPRIPAEQIVTDVCALARRSPQRTGPPHALGLSTYLHSCVCTCGPPSGRGRGLRTDTFCSGNGSASRCGCSRELHNTGWEWTSQSPRPGCCPTSDAVSCGLQLCWYRCSNSHISNSGNGSNFSDWHLKT